MCEIAGVGCRYLAIQQRTVGLVFDSAPSYMHASALHHSSVVTLQGSYPRWAQPLVWALMWLIVGLVTLMSVLLDGFRPMRAGQYWYILCFSPVIAQRMPDETACRGFEMLGGIKIVDAGFGTLLSLLAGCMDYCTLKHSTINPEINRCQRQYAAAHSGELGISRAEGC